MDTNLKPYVQLGAIVKQFEQTYEALPVPKRFEGISSVKDCEKELAVFKEKYKAINQERTAITSKFDSLKKRLMQPEQKVQEFIKGIEADLIAIKREIKVEEDRIRDANKTKAQVIAENQERLSKWLQEAEIVFNKAADYFKSNPTDLDEYVKKVHDLRFAKIPFEHPKHDFKDLELYKPDTKELADSLHRFLSEGQENALTEIKQDATIKSALQQVQQVATEVKIADTKELKYLHEIVPPADYTQMQAILDEYKRVNVEANKYIRVTSWENLKIGQIMKALAKCADEGIEINLETIKTEKL
jgi:hypothetical protein